MIRIGNVVVFRWSLFHKLDFVNTFLEMSLEQMYGWIARFKTSVDDLLHS